MNFFFHFRQVIEEQRKSHNDSDLYHGESWELMERRWNKLEKDFLNKSGQFDISKVPDIYDCIKYDLQHNNVILESEQAQKLYTYAKNMADVVIPQVRFKKIKNEFKSSLFIDFTGVWND